MAPSTAPQAAFETRHIGLNDAATDSMLKTVGASSLEQFLETVLPANIRRHDEMQLKPALSEHQVDSSARGPQFYLLAHQTWH